MKHLKVFLALILVIGCSKKQAYCLKEEDKIKGGGGGTAHHKQELVDTLIKGDSALNAIKKSIENKSLNINEFYKIKKRKEMTPLQIAAAHEQPETVKLLLEQEGVLIDKATQKSKRTALHLAAEKRSQEAATILIGKGANTDKRTVDGKTALHFAAKEGCESIVKTLLSDSVTHDDEASTDYPGRSTDYPGRKSEKYLDPADGDGNTPLHLAAKEGHTPVVRILLEKGANPEIRNHDHKTAKDLAKGWETQQVIANYTLEQQVDATSHTLKSHLTEEYIGDEFIHVKKYLEESKFRAFSKIDDQGKTFLQYTVEKGLEKVVRVLVEFEGEDIIDKIIDESVENQQASHLLHGAVQIGSFEIVKVLIYGDGAIKNNKKLNEEEIERNVVKRRKKAVEKIDSNGLTILHVAAEKGYLGIVKLLVEFMAIAAEQEELEYERGDPNTDVRPQDRMGGEVLYLRRQNTSNYKTAQFLTQEGSLIHLFLQNILDKIEKIRQYLDKGAAVINTRSMAGGLEVLGVALQGSYSAGYHTQEWKYNRKRLMERERLTWRNKEKRFWKASEQDTWTISTNVIDELMKIIKDRPGTNRKNKIKTAIKKEQPLQKSQGVNMLSMLIKKASNGKNILEEALYYDKNFEKNKQMIINILESIDSEEQQKKDLVER